MRKENGPYECWQGQKICNEKVRYSLFFKQTSIFQILRGMEGHHQCVKFVIVLTGRQGWLLLALSRAARFLLSANKQWKKANYFCFTRMWLKTSRKCWNK